MANAKISVTITGPSGENSEKSIVGMVLSATNVPQEIVNGYSEILKAGLSGITKPPVKLEVSAEGDGIEAVSISQDISIAQASAIEVTVFGGLKDMSAANSN